MASEATDPWLTTTQLADRWAGMTTQRVTALAEFLGQRIGGRHVRAVPPRWTTEFSPDAVGLIERELISRGYRRNDGA